ncbi:MAG: class I SAM-dependent DNA methyltransferase [Planctomycetota bacterium]|jgi:SAM-dependent methyltransferase
MASWDSRTTWADKARQGVVTELLADGRARVEVAGGEIFTAAPSAPLAERGVKAEVGQAVLVRPAPGGAWEIARLHRFPSGREEPLLVPAEDTDVEYLVGPGEMRWQDAYLPYLYDWYDPFDDDLSMWRRLAREEGGPILELACGTGRVVIPLALDGHEVTGVDISRAMLDRAAEKIADRAPEAAERVDLVRSDMGCFTGERRYRLAFIACNGLHYMTPAEHRGAALRTLADHLVPGGLGVVSNVAPVVPDLPDSRLPARYLVMSQAGVNPNTGRWTVEYTGHWTDSVTGLDFTGPWRFVEEVPGGSRRTFEFRAPPGHEPEPALPVALTQGETVELMGAVGFRDVEVRSAYELEPPSDTDRVVVFTGRRR